MTVIEALQFALQAFYIVAGVVLLALWLKILQLKLVSRRLDRELESLARKKKFAITNNGESR